MGRENEERREERKEGENVASVEVLWQWDANWGIRVVRYCTCAKFVVMGSACGAILE